MSSSRTVLAFGPGSWPPGWVYGSPRYHLHGLAGEGNRVLYVEPPQGRLRNRAVLRGERSYRPGTFDPWPDRPLTIYHPSTRLFFHPRLPLPEVFLQEWNRTALRRLAREVAIQCRSQNMREYESPDLLWLGAYHHAPLLDRIPHRKSAAFIYDDLPASPAWGARRGRLVARLERQLLERVDLAIFTSRVLLESRKEFCRRTLLLENAVNEAFFDESLPPPPAPGEGSGLLDRIEALDRPRIGYVGAVNLRLDFDLCRALAGAAAERRWQVVFAGGVDRYYSRGVDELKAMPNVHVPGHVPPDEVPRLLRLFDLLILPHVVTPFTRAMFPEKLPEYLATGRPIISSPLPEVERVAAAAKDVADDEGREQRIEDGSGKESGEAPLIRFAATGEAFVEACARCLAESEVGADAEAAARARIALARRHTRAVRLQTLTTALDALFSPEA